MEFVADLHIHSHFSRATSRELDLEHLWIWAQLKGVTVVGTGDFTHPGWFAELESKLVPAEEGLFALKPELERALAEQIPLSCRAPVRFLLSAEISNIYKYGERTRKVHNLVCMPHLDGVSTFSRALARIGNLKSDGRPILGLDSRDLLEITLTSAGGAVLIPAHIWTPWFSAMGSKSGFPSIEECYRDLSPQIFAVETGLSSDPPMNWRLSSLDRFALVSNSDAHSPSKLAREANLFSCDLSYGAIFDALRLPGRPGFEGTLEFFPEEGKYHFDGHRKCDVRMSPEQSREAGGICPVCSKAMTLGVMYQVEELADRPEGFKPPGHSPYFSLVGLAEVLGEVLGVGPATKRVKRAMGQMLEKLGPELTVLRQAPVEEIRGVGGPVLAEALGRMRRGEVLIDGGYDGEFGRVRMLEEHERNVLAGQTALFAPAPPRQKRKPPRSAKKAPPRREPKRRRQKTPLELFPTPPLDPLDGLSKAQREAAAHTATPVVIVAGPGTGKTRTLTRRIAHRILQGVEPSRVLAVTFTNKAAAELRQRLEELLPDPHEYPGPGKGGRGRVCTFHALSLTLINDWRRLRGTPPLRILDEEQRLLLLARLLPGESRRNIVRGAKEVSRAALRGESSPLLGRYRQLLDEGGAMDLDVLVPAAVDLLRQEPSLLQRWQGQCQVVCVDEYQDINRAQYELVRLLCPAGADLCVIGDPDQAIYSFRGADSGYFLRFGEDYPGACQFYLEESYRTATALLDGAYQVIRHNPDRPDSRTRSPLPGAPYVLECPTATAAAEAEYVVHSIERLVGGTSFFSLDSGRLDSEQDAEDGPDERSFGDFAVLFRTAAQAEPLVEAFERSSIPFTCSAGLPGQDALEPVLEFLGRAATGEGDPRLTKRAKKLPLRAALEFLVQKLCEEHCRPLALELVSQIAAQMFGAPAELEGWAKVASALAATLSEADALDHRAEAVSLLTLHAAKGLEYPVVFITGCEEGLLPLHYGGKEDPQALCEERRLMYVGMTRAKEQLILTRASKRRAHGKTRPRRRSRFLGEIEPRLLRETSPDPLPRGRRKRQLKLF